MYQYRSNIDNNYRVSLTDILCKTRISTVYNTSDQDVVAKVYEDINPMKSIFRRELKFYENRQVKSVIGNCLGYRYLHHKKKHVLYLKKYVALESYLKQRLNVINTLDDNLVKRICLQLLNFTLKIHEYGYYHTDINPSNMVYCNKTERAILIDYGSVFNFKQSSYRRPLLNYNFSSLDTHYQKFKYNISDELESLFYSWIVLFSSEALPWHGIGDLTRIKYLKRNTPVEQLVSGIISETIQQIFLNYFHQLKYDIMNRHEINKSFYINLFS